MSKKEWSAYNMALNIGFLIITPILIFGIGGVFLDKYFQAFPIFTMIGFFLAMTSGLLIVWRKSKEMIEDINSQYPPKSKKPNPPTN